MMLADLHAVADDAGGCGETGRGERVGDSTGGLLDVCRPVARGFDVGNDRVDALPGERFDGCVATDAAKLPHCGSGQIVVRVVEPVPAHRGELEVFGRSPSAALPHCGGRGDARLTVVDQSVEVATHAGCAQPESRPDIRSRDRTLFEKKSDHRTAGVAVVGAGSAVTYDSPRMPGRDCLVVLLHADAVDGSAVRARGAG